MPLLTLCRAPLLFGIVRRQGALASFTLGRRAIKLAHSSILLLGSSRRSWLRWGAQTSSRCSGSGNRLSGRNLFRVLRRLIGFFGAWLLYSLSFPNDARGRSGSLSALHARNGRRVDRRHLLGVALRSGDRLRLRRFGRSFDVLLFRNHCLPSRCRVAIY